MKISPFQLLLCYTKKWISPFQPLLCHTKKNEHTSLSATCWPLTTILRRWQPLWQNWTLKGFCIFDANNDKIDWLIWNQRWHQFKLKNKSKLYANVHISPTQFNSRSGFHVFGHSWGSIVATLYAALKPPGDDNHNDGDENPIWNCTSEKTTKKFYWQSLPSGLHTVVLGGALANSKVWDSSWNPRLFNHHLLLFPITVALI